MDVMDDGDRTIVRPAYASCIAPITVFLVWLLASSAFADSPQWRGPDRDGRYAETGLLQSWPEGGPPLLWVHEGLGKGAATPAVVDGVIYVPGMPDRGTGYLFAVNADGSRKWAAPYGEESTVLQAPGPRSTPTIAGELGYLMTGKGAVVCFRTADGTVAWSVDTLERFDGEQLLWNIAESVVVDDDRVYCTPGGDGASLAALDRFTGETVWRSEALSDKSGHCSAILIRHNDRPLLVTMTGDHVVGLNPENGALLWKHEHATRFDIHAVTPVYADGMIYYTSGNNAGGGMLLLSDDGASVTPHWTDRNLDSYHHGVVVHEGYIYGTPHRAGRGLVCLELKTGRLMWQSREVGRGAIVYADNRLYLYEGPKGGVVHLIEPSPEGFKGAGEVEIAHGTDRHWAHPVISNGVMYIRHGDALMAYDVRARSPQP